MKPAAFEYCRPDTLDEALELLHELGPDASVLAGGMSLSVARFRSSIGPRPPRYGCSSP